MTAPSSAESSGRFVIGLLLGLCGSCVLGALLLAPVGFLLVKKSSSSEENRGWRLTPVVVYAVDLEPGTRVTFDMISQRSIPQQFADDSMFRPESAHNLVNQALAAGVRAGDAARLIDLAPDSAADCFPKSQPRESGAPP